MLNKLFHMTLIAPSSAIFDLNSGNLYITNWTDGFGVPPFHRLSERSAGQHGVTDLGFHLDPRLIDFHMTFKASDPSTYWYRRNIITDFIKPSSTPFIIHVMYPDYANPDAERSIYCYLHKGLTFDTRVRTALNQEADFTLIAPDPVWFDPTVITQSVQLDFGDATKNITVPCGGTWLAYPQIVIIGPLLNPSITNNGTGEKIALSYQIQASETVTIECAYGLKTVKNQAGTNLISKVTTDSDLATFHIDPDLTGSAVNQMHVTGTLLVGEHAHVTFNYHDMYIAI